jgi:hypothetical protein
MKANAVECSPCASSESFSAVKGIARPGTSTERSRKQRLIWVDDNMPIQTPHGALAGQRKLKFLGKLRGKKLRGKKYYAGKNKNA